MKKSHPAAANDATPYRDIPRGIEVLVKKAAVDPAFKKLLLEKRAEAAKGIGLKLIAAEEAMLSAVPLPQLEAIIAHTTVKRGQRQVFLGYAAAAMLAAVGSATLTVDCAREEKGPNLSILRRWESNPRTYRARSLPPLETRGGDLDAISSALSGVPIYGSGRIINKAAVTRSAMGYGYEGLGIRPDLPPGKPGLLPLKGQGYVPPTKPSSISDEGGTSPLRSAADISRIVRAHLTGIRNAYKSALTKTPALGSGKIVVIFTILAGGEVENVGIETDTVGHPALAGSIISRIRNWRFPPVEKGDVVVEYPFVFIAEEG